MVAEPSIIADPNGADMVASDPSAMPADTSALEAGHQQPSGNAADLADLGHSGSEKLIKAHKRKHVTEDEEQEILEKLPEEIREEVIEKTAEHEAWNEFKEKAPTGTKMFALFATLLLGAGIVVASALGGVGLALGGMGILPELAGNLLELAPWSAEATLAEGVLGALATVTSASIVGTFWVGGNAAHKKYQDRKTQLEGKNQEEELEIDTPALAKEREVEGPDYKQPGTKEIGELSILANSLYSTPGAIAYAFDEGRERMQDMGAGLRSTIDSIIEKGPASSRRHVMDRAATQEQSMVDRVANTDADINTEAARA